MDRLFYMFFFCLTLFRSAEVFAKVLFIVGPLGVENLTYAQMIAHQSNGKIKHSISYTTRVPCVNEKDEIFITHIDGQSIELLKKQFGKECFFIFLAPSSYQALEKSLKSQCFETKESPQNLEKCLSDAVKELSYESLCDLTIVASELDETVKKIQAVIKALKCDEGCLSEDVNAKSIPKKKLEKYNISEIVRYKFTQEGLKELRNLYHQLPVNPLIADLYNFKSESINVKIHKEFKNLVVWDKEKRFFIEPNPFYGEAEGLNSQNLPYLKYSENGVHLELWAIYPSLLKNSNLEQFWFGSTVSKEKNQKTFQEVENFEDPYLVSLLDLEPKHLLLLKSMKEEVYQHLIKLYNVRTNDDVGLFFHFPYAPKTATLHLHIRVNQKIHPLELAKSISLDRVIQGFEKHQSIEEIILEHQELYKGYIYSDAATLDLPQQISSILIEKVDNIFQSKSSGAREWKDTN